MVWFGERDSKLGDFKGGKEHSLKQHIEMCELCVVDNREQSSI